MTNYDNLPLYKSSYDFLLLIFQLCKNFTKEYKYTIGDDLKKEILSLVKNMGQENLTGQQKPVNVRYDNAKQVRSPFPNF
jgi:hypothetical protein